MDNYYFHMDNLSVGYNRKALIHDICIGIKKGEIVTLIGPNGSGKSTILKSITRQLQIIGGKVYFDNQNLLSFTFRDLSTRMAVVLTERMKPELMTCHDIVATGRYPYTGRLGILTREDEEKVEEAMKAVHAEALGSRDFNNISDGQRQRVLLARAICQEPDIIILDEPTSFLDIKHKLDLLSILRDMAKKKQITVIMSLHEIDLAQKIADKIICVKGDTISHFGKPEEIFEENMIRELYEINNGFFDPLFGSIELPKPEGEAKTFVICGNGTGIPVFRQLQKVHTPFIAGVLYTNDVDYRLARLLADQVITEKPFMEISGETFQKALKAMESCDRVICTSVPVGSCNKRLGELIEAAKKMGCWQENDTYVPSPGDAILYDWQDNGIGDNTGNPDHVGTVIEVHKESDYMVIEEGNYSNAVKKRTLSINGKFIRGFITPKYDDNTVAAPGLSKDKDIKTIAHEVIVGLWGSGENRKKLLTEYGYSYSEVQNMVNQILNGSAVTPSNTKQDQNQSVSKKVVATCSAKQFNKTYAGEYKTTAVLYCRNDAGTNKKAICKIPAGTKVKCYGYYTMANGVKWLYIQFVLDGVQYTGFSSSAYLAK